MMSRSILSIAFSLCVLAAAIGADQLRYSSSRDWREWQLPLGAVEVMPNGSIQPVRIEKDIDATRDAVDLGGGIRRAGSNPRDAFKLIDGNPSTGWAPDPLDEPDDWFVEVDLGTEHLPVVLRKCRTYRRYHDTGTEQHDRGLFPAVVWIVPDPIRATKIRDAIAADRHLTSELFWITYAS